MQIDNTDKHETKDTRTVKEKLFAELEKQSDAFITLAYMYARGYDMAGEDVTKAWTNAVRNTQIIEAAYRRGYEDCQKDIKERKIRDFARKIVYDLDKKLTATAVNNVNNNKGGQNKHGKHKRNKRH